MKEKIADSPTGGFITKSAELENKEAELAAVEADKKRPLLKRIFGAGKINPKHLIQADAIKDDAKIDKLNEEFLNHIALTSDDGKGGYVVHLPPFKVRKSPGPSINGSE